MTGKSSSLPELRKSSKPTYGFAHADVLDEHSSIKPFLSFDKYYFYSNTLTRTHGRSRPSRREVDKNTFKDLASVRSERERAAEATNHHLNTEMWLPKWGTHCHVGISAQTPSDYGNNITRTAEKWWGATDKPLPSKPPPASFNICREHVKPPQPGSDPDDLAIGLREVFPDGHKTFADNMWIPRDKLYTGSPFHFGRSNYGTSKIGEGFKK
jgi:hypothetical protein